MQAEKQNQRTSNGREQRAVLPKKSADGARRSAKRNEHDGKTNYKGERGSEKPAARLLALAQLLHTDAGEHRDIARYERKYAGREK